MIKPITFWPHPPILQEKSEQLHLTFPVSPADLCEAGSDIWTMRRQRGVTPGRNFPLLSGMKEPRHNNAHHDLLEAPLAEM